MRLKNGLFTVHDVKARLEQASVAGSAELGLATPFRYEAKLRLDRTDLAKLEHLTPGVRPPVNLAGRFTGTAEARGTLSPVSIKAKGTGTATDLTVATLQAGTLAFDWEWNDDRIAVSELRAELYKGEISGNASLPLRPGVAGKFDVRFKDLDVGALTKGVRKMPFRLEGRANGSADGTVAAAAPGKDADISGRLDLQAPRLRVQGIPTERLQGTVDYRKKTLEYRFQGGTLGGQFQLNGKLPLDESKPPDSDGEGRLRVEGAQLSRLWRALGIESALGSLRGTVDLGVAFRHVGADPAPVGQGLFTLSRLRWGEIDLSSGIRGQVRLTEQDLRLNDLTGTLGDGLLRGQVSLNVQSAERSWFSIDLTRVEAARLVEGVTAQPGLIQGPLDVRLRGTLGREWHGTADLGM